MVKCIVGDIFCLKLEILKIQFSKKSPIKKLPNQAAFLLDFFRKHIK